MEEIREKVIEALKGIIDPELKMNLVDAGLIRDVEVEGGVVRIKISFTTPFCPLANFLIFSIRRAVEKIEGVKSVDIEVIF
ncbi:metal-sulfur cluster assembly factor [Candidatus Methanodesulfokora washburnensis]|uniref:Metal-sulfur cluster assembly factor n=1 Tax=Candidatus Methanodesulfokora washburnensis TaxID=2478471 RepID=A0A429GPZ2_9CREN|nr:metal-sulfur cluster assembly factor [Candidatus Methanodesulfokores washburnensis]RSN75935.1 metal-sulfur cluster assembly factor [Candidatus Methanodesulfokores washburnensis]